MKPTSPALKSRFQSLVARIRGAVPMAMFGQVGATIADHMFAGTFEDQIVVRLPEAERAMFARMFGGGAFEPMPGRPMREYVAASADVLHDDATLLAWMKRAAAYARTLPPKEKKGGKRGAAKPPTGAIAGGARRPPAQASAVKATSPKRTPVRKVAEKRSTPKRAPLPSRAAAKSPKTRAAPVKRTMARRRSRPTRG